MRTTVVFDRETKEVLACISDEEDCFVKEGIEFRVFEEAEPVFVGLDSTCYLKENAVIVNLKGK